MPSTYAGRDGIDRTMTRLSGRGLDFDINASREAQFVQRFDRLGGRLDDVDQPLVRPNFELLTSLLVDRWTGQNGVAFDSRW